MTPTTSPSAAHAGVKRPHSSPSDQIPTKKRRVHHALRPVQNRPAHTEPAPQDAVFAQGQLLKSISAALVMAGFDSVKAAALEMFRSHVEEYMLHFLHDARTSMNDCRRTLPLPIDFAAALARTDNTSTASLLTPHLNLRVPENISYPTIPGPAPDPPPAPDFAPILKELAVPDYPRTYIPSHFPALPPRHSWQATPDFPKRESDARKMREKATEEGMLAEQALRKLAAAAKSGAMDAERKRNGVLSGEGKVRSRGGSRGPRAHEDTFADVLKDIGGEDDAMYLGLDGAEEAKKSGAHPGMPEGVAVNHDVNNWRRSAARRRR